MKVHTFEDGQVVVLNTGESMTVNEFLNQAIEQAPTPPPKVVTKLAEELYNREWSGQ